MLRLSAGGRRLLVTGVLAAVAAACGKRADDQSKPDWRLRPDGIGPVRTGMTLAQAGTALGEPLVAEYEDFENCDYVHPKGFPQGVSLMVLSDTIGRIDVDTGGVTTVEGAAIGDSEDSILELYKGRVHSEPHKYTGPEGHYLIVEPPGDSLHRIIFETDGRRVTLFRAGLRPAVDLVEGCA